MTRFHNFFLTFFCDFRCVFAALLQVPLRSLPSRHFRLSQKALGRHLGSPWALLGSLFAPWNLQIRSRGRLEAPPSSDATSRLVSISRPCRKARDLLGDPPGSLPGPLGFEFLIFVSAVSPASWTSFRAKASLPKASFRYPWIGATERKVNREVLILSKSLYVKTGSDPI